MPGGVGAGGEIPPATRLGNCLSMADARPGLKELLLFVGRRLQPIGKPPLLLTAVCTVDNFGGGSTNAEGNVATLFTMIQ